MAGEWRSVQLGEVSDLLTGFPFKSERYVEDESAPRLLRGDNVAQGDLRWDGAKRWPVHAVDGVEPYQLRKGDVILAMDRPWIEAGLKYATVRGSDLPALLVQRVARLRGSSRLDTAFLKYVIGSRPFTDHVLGVQTGTAVPHISGGQIKSFEFLLPSLPEQRAIAHILGTLDDKIDLNRRISETQEAMARALFKSWFVDFDPVRAETEGWKFEEMGTHLESSRGFSYDGASIAEGGVPFHNLNSIFEGGGYKYDGIKCLSGEFDDRRAVEPGDVIVANTEQGHDRLLLGSAALIPQRYGPRTPFSHHLYRIRVRPGSPLCPVYVLHLLNDPWMHDVVSRYGNGTTVNMLPTDALELPRIAVPPASLVAQFEAVVLPLHHRTEAAIVESDSLAALRDTLLPKLISGELRVKDAERFIGRTA